MEEWDDALAILRADPELGRLLESEQIATYPAMPPISEREVELARERDRDEGAAGQCEPPVRAFPRPLERIERQRHEDRDPREEVTRAPLRLEVRRHCEREPARE